MTDKQSLQPAKSEPQLSPSDLTEQEQISPLFSLSALSRQAVPPLKPRNQQILQLQRLIGNHATQRYLRPAVPITTGASSSTLQLDRIVADEIRVVLPAAAMTYDDFMTLVAQDAAFRARMVSRSDDGSHIHTTLRDHSNLQAIYQHIQSLVSSGTAVGTVRLEIQFHYQETPRTDGERVSQIEFAAPDLPAVRAPEPPSAEGPAETEPPEFGLETATSRDAYVADAARTLIPRWASMSPYQRSQELFNMINNRLTAIGVPPLLMIPTELSEATGAQFDGGRWGIEISESRFVTTTTAAEINRLISDVYHEARHAEQAFLALRYIYEVADGWTWLAEQLDNKLSGYATHARSAADNAPPMSAQERIEARLYYDERFTNYDITQSINDEYEAAYAHFDEVRDRSHTDEEMREAQERWTRADTAYRRMSGEVDAYDVGNEVGAQLEAINPATP